jgi:xanthine dehydrogenase YagR molybdenum-binding subunit
VGGVSESHRRASQDALAKIFELVAAKLEVPAEKLAAVGGKIVVTDYSGKEFTWKQACSLIGVRPLEVTSAFQREMQGTLSSQDVGGVQMARVAVDTDTGVVKIVKLVAVQDMGLIINRKTAESQIYGALIMSIAAALFEQRINDPKSGLFVNCELSDYKLPRLGDVGELVVHLHEPDSQRSRGVIGLGEPPVISGAVAVSNAVCNALGVRVPTLPLTPKRVLDALRTA